MLAWYSNTQQGVLRHTYFKPNPVHALASLSMCGRTPIQQALENAVMLTNHAGRVEHWAGLDQTRIIIFEDSVKGLQSGLLAAEFLSRLGVCVDLTLIGISNQPAKRNALKIVADIILNDINDFDWESL